ncbi:hypothetical protein A2242_00485 [Candidatus Falkowbacteria bacterium RIFOXYA2_FULL_47_9]|uniref:VanZ-like domain-containing protein n=1 Tax=Candidatus Falkowbacteria bacterium RIFOXYA2_FULL_47_9 TaxID=1797995 RepID=A0A1F5SJG2_9BACT|nr:MAG: hypothetical protein A2242_00485 [Candidatus Falkowbacteria bacterium RIFOXYA2_FULL_47_9]
MLKFTKFLLVLSWLALIFTSSQIGLPDPDPTYKKVLYDYIFDKDVHVFLYSGLAFLILNFLCHYPVRFRRAALWAVAIVFLYGVSDEYHQFFVHGREASLYDLAFDVIGSMAGIAVYWLWTGNERFCNIKK